MTQSDHNTWLGDLFPNVSSIYAQASLAASGTIGYSTLAYTSHGPAPESALHPPSGQISVPGALPPPSWMAAHGPIAPSFDPILYTTIGAAVLSGLAWRKLRDALPKPAL